MVPYWMRSNGTLTLPALKSGGSDRWQLVMHLVQHMNAHRPVETLHKPHFVVWLSVYVSVDYVWNLNIVYMYHSICRHWSFESLFEQILFQFLLDLAEMVYFYVTESIICYFYYLFFGFGFPCCLRGTGVNGIYIKQEAGNPLMTVWVTICVCKSLLASVLNYNEKLSFWENLHSIFEFSSGVWAKGEACTMVTSPNCSWNPQTGHKDVDDLAHGQKQAALLPHVHAQSSVKE